MLKNEKFTNILDILMTSLISLMLIYTSSTFVFSIFFVLVPFNVILVKYGHKEFLISFVISLLFSAIFLDITSIIYIFSYIFTLSLIVGKMIRKEKKFSKIIIISTILSVCFIVIIGVYEYYINSYNIIEGIKTIVDRSIVSMEKVLLEDFNLSDNDLQLYLISLRNTFSYIISILPALTVVSSFLIIISNLFLSIFILRKTGVNLDYDTNITRFKLGDYLKKFVTAFTIIFLFVYLTNINSKDIVINNLSFILMFILSINGTVILYYFLQKKFNRALSVLILLILVLVLQGYSLIAIVGLMDLIFNFRKNVTIRKRER